MTFALKRVAKIGAVPAGLSGWHSVSTLSRRG